MTNNQTTVEYGYPTAMRNLVDSPLSPLAWLVWSPHMALSPHMIEKLDMLITIAAEEYLYAIRLSMGPKYARQVSVALSTLCTEVGWSGEGPLMQSAIWARSIAELCGPEKIREHAAACKKAGTESRFAAALATFATVTWPRGVSRVNPTMNSVNNPFKAANPMAQRGRWLVLAGYAPLANPAAGLRLEAEIRSRIAYASVEVERGLRADCELLGRQLADRIDTGTTIAEEEFDELSRALGWWWVAGNENSGHQEEGFRFGVARSARKGVPVMLPMSSKKTWGLASAQMFEALTDTEIIARIRNLRKHNRENKFLVPIAPALVPPKSGRDLLIASLFCRFMFGDLIVSPTALPRGY